MMYFNSGRNALRFLLSHLRTYFGRPLRIALQDFNCRVVADAVFQSGNRPVLLDIDRTSFSVSLKELKAIKPLPDIFILTNYQGIPHPNYFEVADYCFDNKILMVEDSAQTEGSRINGVETGTLGIAKIESYAFDKPLSVYEGGGLSISKGKMPRDLLDLCYQSYRLLPKESVRKEKADLQALKLLMALTEAERYNKFVGWGGWGNILRIFPYPEVLSSLYASYTGERFLKQLINICLRYSSKSTKIRQMGNKKIFLIERQRIERQPIKTTVNFWEKLCKNLGLRPVKIE
jgi:hypothetical protein